MHGADRAVRRGRSTGSVGCDELHYRRMLVCARAHAPPDAHHALLEAIHARQRALDALRAEEGVGELRLREAVPPRDALHPADQQHVIAGQQHVVYGVHAGALGSSSEGARLQPPPPHAHRVPRRDPQPAAQLEHGLGSSARDLHHAPHLAPAPRHLQLVADPHVGDAHLLAPLRALARGL
eukprot:1247277-Rhodomonas_salina.2